MRISDWSSDVCSSDLAVHLFIEHQAPPPPISAQMPSSPCAIGHLRDATERSRETPQGTTFDDLDSDEADLRVRITAAIDLVLGIVGSEPWCRPIRSMGFPTHSRRPL